MKKVLFCIVVLMCALVVTINAMEIPSASIKNIEATKSSISFNYSLSDTSDNVIMHTQQYSPTVELYDGDTLIKSVEAKETQEGGLYSVTFDQLQGNKDYEIMINAPYDIYGDGTPFNQSPYTLTKSIVKTHKIPASAEILDSTKVGYNDIEVHYDLIDSQQSLIVSEKPQLILYNKNQEVAKVDAVVGDNVSYTFKNLDPNTEYKVALRAKYDVDGDLLVDNQDPFELSSTILNTKPYDEIPIAKINSISSNETSLKVLYDLIDSDNTLINGPILSIYEGAVLVKSVDVTGLSEYEFTGLKANTDYTIKISGEYDLNADGIADNVSPFTLDESTKKTDKVKPVGAINLDESVIGHDFISVNYDLVDQNQSLITSEKPEISLYDGDNEIAKTDALVGNGQVYKFSDLEQGQDYKVILSGKYDINGDEVVDNSEPYTLSEIDFKTNFDVPQGYRPVQSCKDLESIGRGTNYLGATHTDAWSFNDDFALVNDIDCRASNPLDINHGVGVENTYGSDGFEPIGLWTDINGDGWEGGNEIDSISGNFDGQGFYVDGVYINKPNNDKVGFFKLIEDSASVSNLGLRNIEVIGNDFVGTVTGYNYYGEIKNTYSSGSAKGNARIGGLVGYGNSDMITNCYTSAKATGNVDVGGLVGYNEYGNILNSYSTGESSGGSMLGVLVGNAIVKDSFSSGNSKNGLIRTVTEDDTGKPIITNSYQYEGATCSAGCKDYPVVTKAQLNDKNWYSNTLKLDGNYNLLKVDEGYYPHLNKSGSSVELRGQLNISLP